MYDYVDNDPIDFLDSFGLGGGHGKVGSYDGSDDGPTGLGLGLGAGGAVVFLFGLAGPPGWAVDAGALAGALISYLGILDSYGITKPSPSCKK